MDSTGASSSFDSFKSKKLRSFVNKPHLSGGAPDQSQWSSKTSEKPSNSSRRLPSVRQSLRSVNQVREAAKKLQISDRKLSISSDPIASSDAPVSKPNASKSLPEKSFTHSHLAQLKYILLEAIEMKKILVRDDQTSCMKPNLHVTLNFSIVQNDQKLSSDSANILLSKLFRSRLLSFCKSNPEGDEVPEGQLPEPFNKPTRSTSQLQHLLYQNLPKDDEPFKQGSKVLNPETQVENSFTDVDCVSNVVSPVKCSAKLPETPIKGFHLGKKDLDETPVKLISTPINVTPALSARPLVRCFMTPDDDLIVSLKKLTRSASGRKPSKSLAFDTPVKDKTPPLKRAFTDDHDNDLSDILSDDLLSDDLLSDDLLSSIKEKELKALEEQNPEISQAKWRKKMIAGLPKLFDTLLFYFQSIKRTVIVKEELMCHTRPREADEQIRLLLELAPEWVSEKRASNGDLVFCVNKISSPESILTKLSEAN
ncbi:hypothetical protein R6Q57_017502 [Mikania cordata]